MQRRTLLKLGVASAAVLAIAGGAAALLSPGLTDGRLSPVGREVFRSIGRAILDETLPRDEISRQTALDGLLNRIDELSIALAPHAQAELSQLLSLLASAAGRHGLAGLSEPWSSATEAQIQQALQEMRLSNLMLRRQAYAALHDITAAAYFSDAATWPQLGYPGPVRI
ncbi:hypothetical protein [Polaromonas sp. A23]|uniref:hypothetical protein n=1 Tax=Polaromonas sp. A23 TaxID=1944133 RepID=UPI0009879F7A|nr:hypothetical protein [Polaromonas sp. A23]OOG43864.1 hypothetical protein B0B52_08060 [Polaromonas sp. A23]